MVEAAEIGRAHLVGIAGLEVVTGAGFVVRPQLVQLAPGGAVQRAGPVPGSAFAVEPSALAVLGCYFQLELGHLHVAALPFVE